jgi:Alpha-glutamyl/putrescinyl thymine pyrophosphorylase clade 3
LRKLDQLRADDLSQRLAAFSKDIMLLKGISDDSARACLVRQMIDSLHRIEFVKRLGDRQISQHRLDPASLLFDPIKAAFLHTLNGNCDEAAWLVFLATHFGFNTKHKWELTRRVYGALQMAPIWTWPRTSSNLGEFKVWFIENSAGLSDVGFGNHRKYESTKVGAENNLFSTVSSYVAWVGPNRGHAMLFQDVAANYGSDSKSLFDGLYSEMKVVQFGRTAKFDYLTMLGKIGVVGVEPPFPYLSGATGPVRGVSLLLTGDAEAKIKTPELTDLVVNLGASLGVGMQVMEDSLCNWQKSPLRYQGFRG